MLIYNFYTSSAAGGSTQNTRISITNTHPTQVAFGRIFFVYGDAGTIDPRSAAGTYICLAPNQTSSFFTSDVDPGVAGFAVAVATDLNGCPVGFNYLIGRADIKMSAGFQGTLPAQAIAARFNGVFPGCDRDATTATLTFDGSENGYDRLPRVLALDKLGSQMDGNNTFVVVNRLGGNLSFRTGTIGYFHGAMHDETGGSYEFTDSYGRSQYRSVLSDFLPIFGQTKYTALLPAGGRSWLKFWAQNESGLFGAMVNFNFSPNGFNGGQNLRALSLTETTTLVVPIIQPAC